MPIRVAWLAASMLGVAGVGVVALGPAAASDARVRASHASPSLTAFQVSAGGRSFNASLAKDSVATYEWTPTGDSVNWSETIANGKKLGPNPGATQEPIGFGAGSASLPSIIVSPSSQYQTMSGFGGAMTESAADVIDKSAYKSEIIQKLFTSEGAHFNIVRLPLGASDFNATKASSKTGFKSYEDSAGTFSIAHDKAYTIPVLEAVKLAEPKLEIVATPWSAPGWMKSSSEFVTKNCSGSNDYLKGDDYEAYAEYLTNAAEAYQNNKPVGLPFSIISLQNEPHSCTATYPTMKMEPSDEARLSDLLYSELRSPERGLTAPPQILGWDHNWSDYNNEPFKPGTTETKNCKEYERAHATFPQTLLHEGAVVEDIGYHSYCGLPYEPAGLPDLGLSGLNGEPGIYVTESTGTGKNNTNASGNLVYEVQHEIMDPIRDGARASLYWNLALESKDGPEFGNCKKKCRPLVTVNATGAPTYNEDYYYWSQFSRYIQPGATRIASTTSGELDTVAFQNPDGTIVLVVLNGAHLSTEGSGGVSSVSAGKGACASSVLGGVECWGDDDHGELGAGLYPGPDCEGSCSVAPVRVSGITDATSVSAGGEGSACGLLAGGSVTCWGDNYFGQLGNGTIAGPDVCSGEPCSTTPVPVVGITDASQVSVGRDFACALLSGGQVECWGFYGGLGDGYIGSQGCVGGDCSSTPVPVTGITTAIQITAGERHACAILSDRSVECWGSNAFGGLGNGSTVDSGVPVRVNGITTATQISAGNEHTCALLSGGSVSCWGDNADGELGDGTDTGPSLCGGEPCSPTPVPVTGITTTTQVSAGNDHSCALLSGGAIACWGQNQHGQLGTGTYGGPDACSGQDTCSALPASVIGITNATQVSAGEYSDSCAVLSGGGLDCWGDGSDGALGIGTTNIDHSLPAPVAALP